MACKTAAHMAFLGVMLDGVFKVELSVCGSVIWDGVDIISKDGSTDASEDEWAGNEI